eukprot:767394-Hanusia_phi.AAC.1
MFSERRRNRREHRPGLTVQGDLSSVPPGQVKPGGHWAPLGDTEPCGQKYPGAADEQKRNQEQENGRGGK